MGPSMLLLLLFSFFPFGFVQSQRPESYDRAGPEHFHIERKGRRQSVLSDSDGERRTRVPDNLEPLDYYIRIQPYFPNDFVNISEGKNMSFDGEVTFIFRVKNETEKFTIHSLNLNYKNVTLMDYEGNVLGSSYTLNASMEQIVIEPSTPPTVGTTYMIKFIYTGTINNYLVGGLYYTYYIDHDNKTHWMVVTHMEPSSARTVFPCMDEPAFKAIFHITLIYPNGFVALANTMERTPVPLGDGWNVIMFPPTLKMSTYLVAFAVGPYVSKEGTTEEGTLVRVFGWTGQEEYLQFAVETSVKCLHEMGAYTNFKYPMSKSDQIGVPEFVAGAMENFGLIVYKYQYIAFNPNVHSTFVKQAAARVICHELSHQWFGNTVTAMWWDDLFLQEGFAAFFENFGLQLSLPEQIPFLDAKFLVESEQVSLVSDANLNYPSHPLYYYDGPAFDDITYRKGASVLRMIRLTLGPDAFQEAVQDYINNYKFLNANHQMLFEKFTDVATRHSITDWCGRPLNASLFLEPWFHQQSFPLITVTNNKLNGPSELTQEPFNAIETLPSSAYNYTWPIPLFSKNYMNTTYNGTAVFAWLRPEYDNCEGNAFIDSRMVHYDFQNAESRTFARVQYDDIGHDRLIQRLKAKRDSEFTMADKIVLIGDQIALLNKEKDAGKQFSYKRLLEMISIILPNYPYFGTFELSQQVIDPLEKFFIDGPDYGLFKLFMKKLLEESYWTLQWNVTGDWDNDVTRLLMLPYVVRHELVEDSLVQSSLLFNQLLRDCNDTENGVSNCERTHPDLRRAFYCGAIKNGGDNEFNELLKLYELEVEYDFYFYQEFYAMLEGLSCTKSQANMNRMIRAALTAYRLPQDKGRFARMPLYYLTSNPEGSSWMADYLLSSPTEVLNSENLEEYLYAMTLTWYSESRLNQFAEICGTLKRNLTADQAILFEKYYNETQKQVEFGNKYLPDIIRFLYDTVVVGPFDMENWNTRIPANLAPTFYNLTVQPYFPGSASYPWYKNLTLEGQVDITFNVRNATNMIVLNAHRMIIDPADIILKLLSKNETYHFKTITKDYDHAFLTILTNTTLNTGETWLLSIKYKSFVFGVPSKGVYTNTNYFEFNSQKAWIFATYFESGPSARSLAPCFDEPDYKAPWQVTLKHPADLIVLGNMPDLGTTFARDGWATTTFVPTPPMSTYLLSLAAGHFASLQTVSQTGSLIRTWAWTGMEKYAEHALKVIAGTVDFMSTYFDCPYSLPKLDVLALPQYTTMKGAEEHWGLIHAAYRRELADPLYTRTADYADIASVMAHESIHQWFGNLVTISFWPKIFLNEGFANYWETNGVNNSLPEQAVYNNFERYRKQEVGFTADSSLGTSKPVIPDAPAYFTSIPYYKGASLLHMLSNAITPEVLQQGLKAYLKENAYGNVDDETLWASITAAAEEVNTTGSDGNLLNVKDLMDPWMYQATYPVLKLTTSESTVTYSQEPFITNTSALGTSLYNYTWTIPVVTQTSEGFTFRYFDEGVKNSWSRPLGTTWQVENAGGAGFFRVWYDDSTWDLIFKQLSTDSSVFDEITRARFVSDTVALQTRGSVRWSRLLDLLALLEKENDYAPFYAAKSTLDKFLSIFKGTTDFENINKFVQKVTGGAYARFGWSHNGEWTHDLLASITTEYACRTSDLDCLTKTNETFKNFVVHCQYSQSGTGACNSVNPDMRRTQYCYGLRQNSSNFDVVKSLYSWFDSNSKYFDRDNDNLLNAMTCVNDDSLINSLISDTLSGIYPSETLSYIAEHDDTRQRLWTYFTAHVSEVIYGVPDFDYYITSTVQNWNSQADVDRLNEFLSGQSSQILSEDDKASVTEAISKVQLNIDWLAVNQQDIRSWLNSNINLLYQ